MIVGLRPRFVGAGKGLAPYPVYIAGVTIIGLILDDMLMTLLFNSV